MASTDLPVSAAASAYVTVISALSTSAVMSRIPCTAPIADLLPPSPKSHQSCGTDRIALFEQRAEVASTDLAD